MIRRLALLAWYGGQKNGMRRTVAQGCSVAGTTEEHEECGDPSCGDTRVYLEFEVRRVHCRSCGKVKRERLEFLADNPFYTKRFAYYVGRRCRTATIKDIAKVVEA